MSLTKLSAAVLSAVLLELASFGFLSTLFSSLFLLLFGSGPKNFFVSELFFLYTQCFLKKIFFRFLTMCRALFIRKSYQGHSMIIYIWNLRSFPSFVWFFRSVLLFLFHVFIVSSVFSSSVLRLMAYVCSSFLECVCVLHIKPFFLPVDIQHNQCPCRFFNPTRDTSSVVTKLRHRDTTRDDVKASRHLIYYHGVHHLCVVQGSFVTIASLYKKRFSAYRWVRRVTHAHAG